VSVKTSSESESVATRPLDPGEEIDPTEEHTLKPYPIRDSGVLPSPCHERDLGRITGEGAQPKPPASPFFAEKRGWRADRYHHFLAEEMSPSLRKGMAGARSLSVIAATPRALSPMFINLVEPALVPFFRPTAPFLAEKGPPIERI
jgi:hypothetical protein